MSVRELWLIKGSLFGSRVPEVTLLKSRFPMFSDERNPVTCLPRSIGEGLSGPPI